MQFFYREKKVYKGYVAAFALLTLSYFMVFIIFQKLERRAKLVGHTSEIITNLNSLLSCIKDSEIFFRNYIILYDSTAIREFKDKSSCINSTLFALNRQITEDIQEERIDSLFSKINFWQVMLEIISNEFSGNKSENVIHYRLLKGTELTKEINEIVFRMERHESQKLEKINEFQGISRSLKVIHLSTFIIGLLLVIYSMVVFNDVSVDKLRYREQLEEGIEKLKLANEDLINLRSIEKFASSGRIAGYIAHEVRNPLTSISLASEQLGETLKSGDQKDLLNIIARNAERINKLVTELLNSTKFAELNLRRESLNQVVNDTLEVARDRLELNSIKVVKNMSPDPCRIEVDTERMKTAVLNIIINAIEAMEPGKGLLEITTQKNNGKCIVTIKDNGVGMGESSLSRIFEPYFTQKEEGNGLGLTLTQSIILNHQGTIGVESTPGQGTTFTITLKESV